MRSLLGQQFREQGWKYWRLLWVWSGEDSCLLRQCEIRVKLLFAVIGLMVLAVFAFCLCAALYATIQLTDSQVAGWVIGLFFALMMSNLYLLILFTLSRNVLRHHKAKYGLDASRILRFSFLLLIAALVSKPLEYWMFREENRALVEIYKQERTVAHHQKVEALYLDRKKECERILQSSMLSTDLQTRYSERLAALEQAEKHDKEKIDQLLARSHFFIQGMRLHHRHHPGTWWFTLITMLVFTAPAIAKLFIPFRSMYIRRRVDLERSKVRLEYQRMVQEYTGLFHQNTGRRPAFPEPFLDPPFRLRKRPEPAFDPQKQEAFIKDLYHT